MARGGEVERGLSVLEQAPLGGSKAPPSPLGFKLALVVPGRIAGVGCYQSLRLGIVGYLIPVCFIAAVGSGEGVVESLSWWGFVVPGAYNGRGGVRL